MPWLLLELAGTEAQSLRLEEADVTIGRSEEATFLIEHRSLSRQHARIRAEGGEYIVTDLGSKNGTFLNNHRIQRGTLRDGDILRCGEVAFRFCHTRPNPNKSETDSLPLPALTCSLPTRGKPLSGDAALAEDSTDGMAAPTDSALRRDRLKTLLRVSEILAEPGEIDSVLSRILDLCFETLPIERAAILLVNPANNRLEATSLRSLRALSPGEQIWSRHIVDYVRTHAVAALFSNTRTDPRLAQAASVMAQSICSSMCVPLRPRSEIIGVLYVDNVTLADRFASSDLAFLAGFANQAAMAIHNARLSRELERRAVLENNLLRFFPKAICTRLMEAPATLHDPTETEVTALFADITGYTRLASRLAPREVFALLNDYFPILAAAVFRYEGTLEKYIGDAVLAVWGAPFRGPDDARRALAAAVDMQSGIRELSQAWEDRLGSPLRIHIGLHTGTVAAGNIGVDSYLQYATIGDPINLASRISNAAGPGEIVISDTTRLALGDCRYALDRLPTVELKNHPGAGSLYRVRWS
ncbi:MAG: FHA domain-containing protein [Myxococcales bacterium]|nr:FHA domain-containing protein [Myxococcales bacterium]